MPQGRVAQTAECGPSSAAAMSNPQKRPVFPAPEPINYDLFTGFRVGQHILKTPAIRGNTPPCSCVLFASVGNTPVGIGRCRLVAPRQKVCYRRRSTGQHRKVLAFFL